MAKIFFKNQKGIQYTDQYKVYYKTLVSGIVAYPTQDMWTNGKNKHEVIAKFFKKHYPTCVITKVEYQ